MPPAALQIEITEQSLIHDFDISEHNLRSLKNLGCRIAIDDFGTGNVPDRLDMTAVVQFWDTAEGIAEHNDYSVGVSWGYDRGIWYLTDLFRGRLSFPKLKEVVWEFARRHEADQIYIEGASSGPPLVQQLRHEGKSVFFERRVAIEKDVRFFTATDFLQSSCVAILNAKWTPDVRRELSGFPFLDHDDIVDAISLFANWANGREGEDFIAKARNGGRRPRPSPRRPSRYDRFRYS